MNMLEKTGFTVESTRKAHFPVMNRFKQLEIFLPFTQADASTTRKHGGSGLGLTICRRLIDLMGGTMDLKSEMGRGSAFAFTIPLTPATKAILADWRKDPAAWSVERGGAG